MISKESLLRIPELNLAGRVTDMTDVQFNGYVLTLNTFIDRFPAQADKMRDATDDKDYIALSRTLTEVCVVLKQLYADKMAKECDKRINVLKSASIKGVDHDEVESFVEQFIQTVSALSIDIQMAAHSSRVSAQPRPRPATAQIYNRNQPLILAVDNAVMFLNTMKKLLKDAPYDLHTTTSCADALDYLQSSRPDIFLLDIEMPEMDGYELARRIKNSGQKAPIIFITANSAREYVDKAVEVGAAGLLMKPLRVNQLLAKLKEFV